MTRDDATAQITDYKAQTGELPVGSVVAFEDAANPRRLGTVIGYSDTQYGRNAVLSMSDSEFWFVSSKDLSSVPRHGSAEYTSGWCVVLDLRV